MSEKWMAEHPDYLRTYYMAHREEHAARSRKNKYGITAEQYAERLREQGGVCAICRQPETSKYASGMTKALAVDHDHSCCVGQGSCGKCLRGLLCSNCNTALARMRDDPNILRAAAGYLESYRCG